MSDLHRCLLVGRDNFLKAGHVFQKRPTRLSGILLKLRSLLGCQCGHEMQVPLVERGTVEEVQPHAIPPQSCYPED